MEAGNGTEGLRPGVRGSIRNTGQASELPLEADAGEYPIDGYVTRGEVGAADCGPGVDQTGSDYEVALLLAGTGRTGDLW